MRMVPTPFLLLLATLPVCSQTAEGAWSVDVHRFSPSLSGHIQSRSASNPFDVNFQDDLGLAKDSTKIGYGLEYQGRRFAVELSRDEQDYRGSSLVGRAITINGQTYSANTLVTSTLKATNTTFNWTLRALALPQFWVGLDLGARATQLELNASGTAAGVGQTSVAYKTTLPIPQIGPSLGFSAMNGRLVGRGEVHLLAYKGASYTHSGVDLRYFPLSWLGVRAFVDAEHSRVPQGSIKSDLDITLDRSGAGFGLVARF